MDNVRMRGALEERAPLVGRGEELQRIASRLDQPPAAFVLAGAAGVGKTRLATEAARAAAGRGFATEEVAASRAASSIPFGPFAPLLPSGARAPDRLELLRQASATILARAGDRQLLLVVDDAHLLDDGSAALVHQLVQTDACSVIATVRSLEPAPDPVTALWKDGLAERVDLEPLSEGEVEQVVAGVLGGPIARASVRRLWQASEGNALYLRELLAGASESGAVRESGGIWALNLPLAAPTRLVELIASRLQGIAAETLVAIQLVAAGEPLSLAVLERLSSPAAIEDAEGRGFVQMVEDGRRVEVRLAHPLYGETVRRTLPAYRRRRISARLASEVAATGARRRGDLLRIARWQLEAGARASDPQLLGRAARRALEMFDMTLAAELAERALECGGGFDAGLVLGEAKFRSGQLEQAESVLAALAARCSDELELARVANARAYNLHTLIGDAEGAAAVLDEALTRISDPAARLRIVARKAANRLFEGRPAAALADIQPLLAAGDDDNAARGAYVAAVSLALLGRTNEAVAMSARGLDAQGRSTVTTPLREAHLIGASLARTASGELAEAEATAEVIYEACLSAGDAEGQATGWLLRAYALVEQGRPTSAARAFLESASLNRELQDVTALRWCLGGVALAHGLCGRAGQALAAVAELAELRPAGPIAMHEFDIVERGRAWALVAAGDLAGARAALAEAARSAARLGQLVAEAKLLHDLARLGDPGPFAARLSELAATMESPLVAGFARHAGGLAREAPSEVEAAALTFAALGANLLAAEAEITAARLFRAEGLLRREAASARRAQELLERCEDARTPGLARSPELAHLTRREREIASLAATGASSREIADRLVLSIRTVDNHLQNAYGKLGISGRAALGQALAGAGAGATGGGN